MGYCESFCKKFSLTEFNDFMEPRVSELNTLTKFFMQNVKINKDKYMKDYVNTRKTKKEMRKEESERRLKDGPNDYYS